MSAIRAIFWDVGGVLLTNAWDHTERAEALEHFHLDAKEFQARHEMVVSSFERGKISLNEYLDRTVFYSARPFTRDQFRDYMLSLSRPMPDVLNFARTLAGAGKYFMGTINNESRDLNLYRIEKFGLRELFRVFVSSCFVGLRSPTKQELTNNPKISRRPNFSMRCRFSSRDSLLIVPMKYLPESARARAKARTSGIGCDNENM